MLQCSILLFLFIFLEVGLPDPSPTHNHPRPTQVFCSNLAPLSPSVPLSFFCLILPLRGNFLPLCAIMSFCILALANDILLHVMIIVLLCLPPKYHGPLAVPHSRSYPQHLPGEQVPETFLEGFGMGLEGVKLSKGDFLAEAFWYFVEFESHGAICRRSTR